MPPGDERLLYEVNVVWKASKQALISLMYERKMENCDHSAFSFDINKRVVLVLRMLLLEPPYKINYSPSHKKFEAFLPADLER